MALLFGTFDDARNAVIAINVQRTARMIKNEGSFYRCHKYHVCAYNDKYQVCFTSLMPDEYDIYCDVDCAGTMIPQKPALRQLPPALKMRPEPPKRKRSAPDNFQHREQPESVHMTANSTNASWAIMPCSQGADWSLSIGNGLKLKDVEASSIKTSFNITARMSPDENRPVQEYEMCDKLVRFMLQNHQKQSKASAETLRKMFKIVRFLYKERLVSTAVPLSTNMNLHLFLPSLGSQIAEIKLKAYIAAAKSLSSFEYRSAEGNEAFQRLCPLEKLETPITTAMITEAKLRDKGAKRTAVKDRDRSGGFQSCSWPSEQRLEAYVANNMKTANASPWELIQANQNWSMLIGQFTGHNHHNQSTLSTYSHIPFNSIIVQSYTIQLYQHTVIFHSTLSYR